MCAALTASKRPMWEQAKVSRLWVGQQFGPSEVADAFCHTCLAGADQTATDIQPAFKK